MSDKQLRLRFAFRQYVVCPSITTSSYASDVSLLFVCPLPRVRNANVIPVTVAQTAQFANVPKVSILCNSRTLT